MRNNFNFYVIKLIYTTFMNAVHLCIGVFTQRYTTFENELNCHTDTEIASKICSLLFCTILFVGRGCSFYAHSLTISVATYTIMMNYNCMLQAEDIYLLIAYDPLKEEIGSWNELGSSRASSYQAYSDYESSRVSNHKYH